MLTCTGECNIINDDGIHVCDRCGIITGINFAESYSSDTSAYLPKTIHSYYRRRNRLKSIFFELASLRKIDSHMIACVKFLVGKNQKERKVIPRLFKYKDVSKKSHMLIQLINEGKPPLISASDTEYLATLFQRILEMFEARKNADKSVSYNFVMYKILNHIPRLKYLQPWFPLPVSSSSLKRSNAIWDRMKHDAICLLKEYPCTK